VFEAVRCAFEAIARRQPTVVFLDDLQWADHTTLELLGSLATHVADVPLLLLGAYRSDELGRDANKRLAPEPRTSPPAGTFTARALCDGMLTRRVSVY
jgi:predicted ATPase